MDRAKGERGYCLAGPRPSIAQAGAHHGDRFADVGVVVVVTLPATGIAAVDDGVDVPVLVVVLGYDQGLVFLTRLKYPLEGGGQLLGSAAVDHPITGTTWVGVFL